MCDTQEDVKSKHKLAQLWRVVQYANQHARSKDSHNAIVKNVLNGEFNINHRVTIRCDNVTSQRNSNLKDCTALHFTCYNNQDIDTFNKLLERGADFTARNSKGDTVLHLILSFQDILELVPFIESVLSSHVKYKNAANPQNNQGLSHLHAACIANHVDSLNLFLDADAALVNQTTNSNCDLTPEFTPLHFTVLFNSYEVAKILVSRGADVNAKNASGMTPLDACLKRRLKLFRRLSSKSQGKKEGYRYKLRKNEMLIKLFLDSGCVSTVGLSKLHIASTLKDLSIAEKILTQDDVDVDYPVPMESPINPGYTAAHFATLNSIDAVKILLRSGAKLETKNLEGTSVLDLCVKEYSSQDVRDMLASFEDWKNLRLSDGITTILNLLQAAVSVDQFKLFLKNVAKDAIVPSDSLLWQGCTKLHLAVILAKGIEYDTSVVEECLRFGQSINMQNSRGESAIHLAFRLNKRNILQLLLERLDNQDRVEDVLDQDNLSYLHIACIEKKVSLVEKLLRTSNPNVVFQGKNIFYEKILVTGATPLHAVACNRVFALAEMLLRHGADLHAMDSKGMTPIHYLMKRGSSRADRRNADMFFRYLLDDPRDCVNSNIGLSYLHVASFHGKMQAVQKLLEIGTDVNAVVIASEKQMRDAGLMFLTNYLTCTPLHMTQARPIGEVIELLIIRGADVFAKSSNKFLTRCSTDFNCPLDHKAIMRRFMLILWDREDMQKSWEQKTGLTRLHIACCLKNEESVRNLLEDEVVNVNAQMHKDSEIFSGCTPLHLLLTLSHRDFFPTAGNLNQNLEQFNVSPTIQMLLNRGADVTIMDAENNTAIHRLSMYYNYFSDAELGTDLLLNAHQDFSINPTNEDGMSHFHLACYWHKVEVVEKFLVQGSVDVNLPTEFFVNKEPGATPLHLALMSHQNPDWPRISRIVDLLLKHGADVAARDVYGETPLHKPLVLRSPEFSILNELLSHGADIEAENVEGLTPLDKTLSRENNNTNDLISCFKKYNYRINNWNRMTGEGSIGRMLSLRNRNITESPEFKEVLQSPDVREVDEMGRTVIHNAVATRTSNSRINENILLGIEKLVALGIDVDRQDMSGRTALHYAARMENRAGARALLKCGADANIVDKNKITAFSHAVYNVDWKEKLSNHVLERVPMTLHLHVQKLLYLRIDVIELNQKLSESIQQTFDGMDPVTRRQYGQKTRLDETFFSQIEMSKAVEVGAASLVLFDFLSETNGVTRYPYLLASNRNIVDDFFELFDDKEFDELGGIVKLQYRKMKARLKMIDEALTALRTLLGFSIPGLCEEIIRYLPNSDLRNLIASTTV